MTFTVSVKPHKHTYDGDLNPYESRTQTQDKQILTQLRDATADMLTSLFVDPVHEEVHGADLGQLVVRAVQPEDLLTVVLLQCLVLDGDGGAVVPETDQQCHGAKWSLCI